MQKKDCVPIKFCRLCNSKNLKKVFDLGVSPLANSYSKVENSKKFHHHVYFVLGILWVFPSMYILRPFKKR